MLALFPVNIRLALRSLGRNRLRTLLTMLGIIIGVAAVLTMVALGTGARAAVEGEVSSAGTRLIFVRAGNYTRGGDSIGITAGLGAAKTLTPEDAEAIKAIEGVDTVSRGIDLRDNLTAGRVRSFARVQGVEPGYDKGYGWVIDPGRMLADGSREAVVGKTLAAQLFGSTDEALGKTVTLRGVDFTVVGVTDGVSEDHSEVLFVPWQSLQAMRGGTDLDTIVVAAEKAGEASKVSDEVKKLLRERHGRATTPDASRGYIAAQAGGGGTPDDFTVETQAARALTKGLYTPAAAFALANLPKLDEVTLEEMADTLDRASDTMTALLASIAGVSLVVGGIGIMNIMLVSVTERTREIGIRMAIGAPRRAIRLQFLLEALMLSLIGCTIGVLTGTSLAKAADNFIGFDTQVTATAVLTAFAVSAAIGIFFGWWPATRAARLSPIEALRS